jgi:hypothetical protein
VVQSTNSFYYPPSCTVTSNPIAAEFEVTLAEVYVYRFSEGVTTSIVIRKGRYPIGEFVYLLGGKDGDGVGVQVESVDSLYEMGPIEFF